MHMHIGYAIRRLHRGPGVDILVVIAHVYEKYVVSDRHCRECRGTDQEMLVWQNF